MATTIALTLRRQLSGSYAKSIDLTSGKESVAIDYADSYAEGVGANQADIFVSDERTLVATSENIDLTATLADFFGTTVDLQLVKELIIRNKNTGAGESLTVSGTALTGMGTITSITVKPGGTFHWSDPLDGASIVNTTQDVLTINSGANTVTYDIVIVGVKT